MKPLVLIYWTRVALAIVAAAISTVITLMFGERGINTFLNGITIALLVYLLTYYVFKAKFSSQIEKKSKIMSMGIGIYFFTWILVWVLMYTTAIALGFAPAA